MRIRPIRSEADYDAAVARIRQLMGAAPGSEAGDELEILATLVDAWEARNFPIDAPDPTVVLSFVLEQQGLTRKDLEPMIGSRARVSEILSGKRELTLRMIRRLAAGLGIPAELLIGVENAKRRWNRTPERKKPTRANVAPRLAAAR